MTDIALDYDNDTGFGDWVITPNGDLAAGNDLETAIMVSIFTDALATSDFVPWDSTNDRRGWWGDTFETSPIGSTLWQLDRAAFRGNNNLLLQARDAVKTCLQWLIDGGIAASISVTTSKIGTEGLGIAVVVTKPVTNVKVPFNYVYLWAQEGL